MNLSAVDLGIVSLCSITQWQHYIHDEEVGGSGTWGKKTLLLLSRFSENSPHLTCQAELPPPQTPGTSPPRRGCSLHLRDYSSLQMPVWCVWGKGFFLSITLFKTQFRVQSKDKKKMLWCIFLRGSANRWQLPVVCHLVPSYLRPAQVGGAADCLPSAFTSGESLAGRRLIRPSPAK